MSVKFRKDRDRWQASGTVDGKRIRILCDTKKQAQEIDTDLKLKRHGLLGINSRYLLKDAFASFLETESELKTEASKKADSWFFDLALSYFNAQSLFHVEQITLEDLQKSRIFMQKSRKWSDTTTASRCKLLKAVFNKLMISGRIAKSPAEHWKIPTGTAKRRRPMTRQEFQKLMNLEMPSWLRPVLHFIRLTGARGATVASLKWRDVDYEKRTVYLSSRKGKLRSTKVVPFPIYDELLNLFDSLSLANGMPNSFVFTDQYNEPLTGHQISDAAHRLIKRSGLDGVVLYSLRHSLAVDLTEAGVSMEITRQLMGHSNISQTQAYAQGVGHDSLKNSVDLIRGKTEGEEK